MGLSDKDYEIKIASNNMKHVERERLGRKRFRSSSPVSDIYDIQIKRLQLMKSRIKYALMAPKDFIPSEFFDKFPAVRSGYRLVTSIDLSLADVNIAINEFKSLLLMV